MPNSLRCYKVVLRTIDPTASKTCKHFGVKDVKPEYYDCINGVLYITTDEPKRIYDWFGKETVISIEEIGMALVV